MPVITFKVTESEARLIRSRARAAKARSVSEFLRTSVLGGRSPHAKVVRRKHPVSGLTCNAATGPEVSEAQIREALSDFP